ncbi:MAG: OmpH family outer membrane protein [Spirochaetaceae bacterium]|nr:OmpH family outer membrane protein [Spirochaetaceae bacterium]
MKRTISTIFVILAVLFTSPLGAEQITKVAVLDYTRILSSFYADSAEARHIEELKTVFAEEVRRLQEEIQDLEERKLDAENRGNPRDALELDSVIQDKKRYYQEYVRVRGNQIQQAAADLGSSNALAGEILREIQYVAESNGFSLVLKRSDPNLLWWSYEVDITELVLQRLMSGN